ncbi:MAG: hypothetical protein ACKVQT_08855 [Burkholderiales bacterium]
MKTDDPNQPARRRFDELVPWYVTGELTRPDRDWVDRYLADHPEAHDELAWHRSLAGAVDEELRALPEGAGWQGLAARLKQEAAAKPRATLLDRLTGWLAGLIAHPGYALAAALIAAQAVVIGTLLQQRADPPEFGQMRGGAQDSEVLLQVRFQQQATERDLRMLLNESGARIVDGPDQLGDYLIASRSGLLDELRVALAQSTLVVRVEHYERKGAAGEAKRP